jgi:DNA-binding response OmpR family regulator
VAAARILVCDDHDLVRRVIARQLADEGHEVIEAADVRTAIEAIDTATIALVVLDLHLRGESGSAVIAHLRADSARAPIPVILMSGDFDGATDGYARAYGADAVMAKPFEPDALTAMVHALLGEA